jgi:hypothetical protein
MFKCGLKAYVQQWQIEHFFIFQKLSDFALRPETVGSGVLLKREADDGSPKPLFKELGTIGGTYPDDIILFIFPYVGVIGIVF